MEVEGKSAGPFFLVFLHKQASGPYCVQSQLTLSWGGRKAALGKKGFLLAERKTWALNPKAVAPATGTPTSGLPLWY